jgi:DNA repair exonuclease SbcCD ATPase subunit
VILEGFEIENWSCIKRVSVSGLPATGVVVLHAPNRHGKSSIVQALRACLMDYSSTTTALKSSYPRGTSEKPKVTVTFRAGGGTYRVMKCFGSNKNEFASRTATGAWKVEATTASEVHSRVCACAGAEDSTKGLHQLLWLTQAEFRLPKTKDFDGSVQTQLRGILGVLQTPSDDRFIEQVTKRWNEWYSGQRKAGKTRNIKASCKLAEHLLALAEAQKELSDSETKFKEVESLLRQTADLESAKLDLNRQLTERSAELRMLQEERQRSQDRIRARQQAEKDHKAAEGELTKALQEQQQRADASQRCRDDEKAIEPAAKEVENASLRVETVSRQLEQLRNDLETRRVQQRALQTRAGRVVAKMTGLARTAQLEAAKRDCERAETIAGEMAECQRYLDDHPAPDDQTLKALRSNRSEASQLRADLNAACIRLTLTLETGAPTSRLSIDEGPPREVAPANGPKTQSIGRHAELEISGWGTMEFARGTGSADLDQIEHKVRKLDQDFASALSPLGIAASDPQALDLLLERFAAHQQRTRELTAKKQELKKLAPTGLDVLRAKVRELQTQLADIAKPEGAGTEPLPAEQGALEQLAMSLKQQLAVHDQTIQSVEDAIKETLSKAATEQRKETTAKEKLASVKAKASSSKDELGRLRAEAQISQRLEEARLAVADAQTKLKQSELTKEELTIEERVAAVQEAVAALDKQIEDNTRKYDVIKGRLLESEGLHGRRSALAARVDELTRLTQRECLEKDAVDRLYALFEECRERQLGTLLKPIEDRVLSWLQVLEIGDYKEIGFNDAFLPEKLKTRDGTAEFAVDEESTGAQEQIGMLIRLALGSTLSSAAEPAVAILDDPLTHCDVGRLSKMRIILRRAAEGDPCLTPPAGPLQIITLTCHPEWFRDEKATVIDLEDSNVMSRWPV